MSDCVYTTDVHLDKDGYPRVKWGGRLWRMNRLIYTFVHGDIPDGKVIGHYCNNKGCINPSHLYLTDAATNSSHAARDGLYKTKEDHPKSKINSDIAETIRQQYDEFGWSQEYIGTLHGIAQSTVSAIIRNEIWK